VVVDKEDLGRKKEVIRKEGKHKVHVVTDFDRILTKAFVDGKKSFTTGPI